MRRTTIALLAATVALAGCAQAGQLGDDARSRIDDARGRLDDVVTRADEIGDRLTWCGAAVRLGRAVADRDADSAQAAAEDLQATAPAELADELRIVVEAGARAQAGQPQALLDSEVQDAARVVLETARESCGVG